MKHKLALLLKYLSRLGFLNGLRCFVKLYLLKARKVQLAGYPVIQLRANSTDIDIFNQVLINEEYKLVLPDAPAVIVDGGGNIGLTALYFAQKYPQASIFTFEPDAANYQVLSANTHSIPRIQAFEEALWYHNNGVYMQAAAANDSHSVTANASDTASMVATKTLLRLIHEKKISCIDVLKLDIEGAEKELFEHDAQQWLPYIKTLVIELHDRFKPGCSKSLFTALQSHTYDLSIQGELLIINLKH